MENGGTALLILKFDKTAVSSAPHAPAAFTTRKDLRVPTEQAGRAPAPSRRCAENLSS
jgi:hypothetical protein